MNPQVKILLVDDSEESLVALEAVLKPLQQRLYRARSGPEAMKLLLRHDVAVVLLDVLMPGMDGFETAAHIKRLDQTRDVPIIFLTAGEPGAGAAFRGYAVGAADYLTKPFDPWVLRSKVSVFIDLFRKNAALRERTGTPARTPARMVEDASGDAGALTGFAERLGAVEARLEGLARDCADDAGLRRTIGELVSEVSAMRESFDTIRR
jgi:CheY-like chemotaxis protein